MTDTTLVMPWNQQVYADVVGKHGSKRLPHALLLEGSAGIGKRLLAQALAVRVHCQDASPDTLEPCGVCKTCKLHEAETHPDFKMIEPEEPGRMIKVDRIRELIEFLGQSSSQGGFKVAVISPAEAMNNNSANALLKNLEEPPSDTLIILVTSQPGFLLPTIRSRCQSILVPKPRLQVATDWLMDRFGKDRNREELSSLLALESGSPLEVSKLLEEGIDEELKAMLIALSAVLKRNVTVTNAAEHWADDHATKRVLWLCQWIQQIIKYASSGDDSVFSHPDSVKMFKYIGDKTRLEVLFELEEYTRLQWSLLQGPSNPDKLLLFENILIRWQGLMLKSAHRQRVVGA